MGASRLQCRVGLGLLGRIGSIPPRQHRAAASPAVKQHLQRLLELQVTHCAVLGDRRLRLEPAPVDGAARGGEVADAERNDILEEVRALARLDRHVCQLALDDGASARNLRPVYRDAKPRVGRAPAARADEQVGAPRARQLAVQLLDDLRGFARLGAVEPVGVDVDDVTYLLDDTIAERLR